jgi:hypothetical protein
LRGWLKRVSVTYHSPHKFRHGHAVYALRLAQDIAALKAMSQNLMHEHLSITDWVHGILFETDRRQQIASLGGEVTNGDEMQELRSLINRHLVKSQGQR